MRKNLRESILLFLEQTNNHPTASEIYNQILPQLGSIDKKIFLEELDLLAKNKNISVIIDQARVKHYDIIASYHYHFICENCGAVRDLSVRKGAIRMLIDHAQKFINSFAQINKIYMSFWGICYKCKQTITKKQKLF